MLVQLICLSLVSFCIAEMTESEIDHVTSDGMKNLGYRTEYGDESIINQAVSDLEKGEVLKSKWRLTNGVKALPAEDVKCLISVDRYCSKEMLHMKSVLIQAVKEDCINCALEDKNKAGQVVASLMAHDPTAWKMFLTRYDGLQKIQRMHN